MRLIVTDKDNQKMIQLRQMIGCALPDVMNFYRDFLQNLSKLYEEKNNGASVSCETSQCKTKCSPEASCCDLERGYLLYLEERFLISQKDIMKAYCKMVLQLTDFRDEKAKAVIEKKKNNPVYKVLVYEYDEANKEVKILTASAGSDFTLNSPDFRIWVRDVFQSLCRNTHVNEIASKTNRLIVYANEFIDYEFITEKSNETLYVASRNKGVKGVPEFMESVVIVEHEGGSEEALRIMTSKITSNKFTTLQELQESLGENSHLLAKLNDAKIKSVKTFYA